MEQCELLSLKAVSEVLDYILDEYLLEILDEAQLLFVWLM